MSFSAKTSLAAATQLYLRYGSGTDDHTLNLGVRVSRSGFGRWRQGAVECGRGIR